MTFGCNDQCATYYITTTVQYLANKNTIDDITVCSLETMRHENAIYSSQRLCEIEALFVL